MNCTASYIRSEAMKSGLAWILIRPNLSTRAGPDSEIISAAVGGEPGNPSLLKKPELPLPGALFYG